MIKVKTPRGVAYVSPGHVTAIVPCSGGAYIASVNVFLIGGMSVPVDLDGQSPQSVADDLALQIRKVKEKRG